MTQKQFLPSGHPKIDTLEMRNIVKRFPGVLANDCVNFDVHGGEVHALLGENGAGKSTLMKQLYGLYHPDEGQIIFDGQPQIIHTPKDAIRLGIGMIHQHFMLVDSLTVAENVALGLPSSRGLITDLDRVSGRIKELAQVYGLDVDPDAYIWQLSVGQQQKVEIIKALYRGAALLILDEPTAVLTPQEVDDFFVTLTQMAKDGHALIFISHNLSVVRHISHDVMVMCLGRVVESAPRDAFYARPLHPYSQALMDAVPEPDPRRERGRLGQSLPGELPSPLAPPPGCVFASRCPQVGDLCSSRRPDLRVVAPERLTACHFVEPAP